MTRRIGAYLHAQAFFVSARWLAQSVDQRALKLSFNAPIRHLYCDALENVLKSFLRTRRFDEETLRREFGHGLERLYAEAVKRGLRLGRRGARERRALIAVLSRRHDRPFTHRYLRTGRYDDPSLSRIDDLAELLFEAIGPLVASAEGLPRNRHEPRPSRR